MESVRDRATFERLVAGTATRPLTPAEIAAELERKTLHHLEPDRGGLDKLGWYLGTSRHAGTTPIALLVASPS